MSTSGSVRSSARLVRWQGLVPLAFLAILLGGGWLLLGDRVVRETAEEAVTKLLGTHVEAATLEIRETESAVRIGGLQVADPFDPMRNIVEAREILIELDPVPLLEKKLVVRRLRVGGLQLGTDRAIASPPADGDGFAATLVGEMRAWAARFRRPIASFTPVDTIRALALDPEQLATVRAARALAGRADSVTDALDAALHALRIEEVVDSARALAQRIGATNPRALGIEGTRRALTDVRRTIVAIDSAKRGAESLTRDLRAGYAALRADALDLDAARREDHAFARSLLVLPTVEGPELSSALFGDVTIQRFQQAVYWAELARRHMPPGLRPRVEVGPRRLRMSGTTMRFPKARAYPSFLLQAGDVDVTVGGEGPAAGRYVASIANLTSEPAIVRQPVVVSARRVTEGAAAASVRVNAVLDHLGPRPRDSLGVLAAGLRLPSLDLPGLPLRAELGQGSSRLDFVRSGDRVAARWVLRANEVRWRADPVRATRLSPVETLVFRVLSGIGELDLTADLTGELRSPKLSIRSNLDRALSDRLRAVLGEEIARAETRVRAEVDRVVAEHAGPVRARVAAVEAEGARRLGEARARLDEQRGRLEEQLKGLTGFPGIKPPGG